MPTNRDRLVSALKSKKQRLAKARASLARTQAALAAADRKRDTRWKIVVGGSVLAQALSDARYAVRLDALLEASLRSKRDRPLLEEWRRTVGLQPAEASPAAASAAPPTDADGTPTVLRGFRPSKLDDGTWGSRADGADADGLPEDLVGSRIRVAPRRGEPWTATVREVLQRRPGRVIVRDSGRPR